MLFCKFHYPTNVSLQILCSTRILFHNDFKYFDIQSHHLLLSLIEILFCQISFQWNARIYATLIPTKAFVNVFEQRGIWWRHYIFFAFTNFVASYLLVFRELHYIEGLFVYTTDIPFGESITSEIRYFVNISIKYYQIDFVWFYITLRWVCIFLFSSEIVENAVTNDIFTFPFVFLKAVVNSRVIVFDAVTGIIVSPYRNS